MKDASGYIVLRIEKHGPMTFDVLLITNRRTGKISKHWGDLVKELFTDADNSEISFPMELDVSMKAVMLGACFPIVSYFIS